MKLVLIFSICLLLTIQSIFGQGKSYLIDVDKSYIDANDTVFNAVGPGDTLLFVAGHRNLLLIKNFKGDQNHPIVMINSGGDVIIDTDHYFGISIQNCRYFKLTGTGNPTQTYGFKIKKVSNGAGIGIGDLSSDFELDHVSIENCKSAGIFAKTDPYCSPASVRGSFTQYNTHIHDNYIANVGVEGMYIGSTKYYGQTVNCNNKDTLLMPSLLDGVRIYNNIIKYTGWDGIQVSSASNNCQIYNNTVLFDSQAEQYAQMSGILIGGGSKCDCFNNFISQGKGNGIENHGIGGFRIFNNIIVDAGRSFKSNDLSQMKHGIFVTDVSIQTDSAFFILHNNIINPKSDGIRFSSIKSKNNIFASNIIINPGNFDYYENGNTSFKGKDSYFMFQNVASNATLHNNYLARNDVKAGFSKQNMHSADEFKLVKGSPLIDAAYTESWVAFDFSDRPRPYDTQSDIGAFEYDPSDSSIIQLPYQEQNCLLMQNPVKELLKISILDELGSEFVIEIFNLQGDNVLMKSKLKPENHIIEVNVSSLVAGIYIYRIRAETFSESGKFVVL